MIVNILVNAALVVSMGVFASAVTYRIALRIYKNHEINRSCEAQKATYNRLHTPYEWTGSYTADASLITENSDSSGGKRNAKALSTLRKIA